MQPDSSLSVVMSGREYSKIRELLFTPDGCENFAVLFCGSADGPDWRRLLVREIWPASSDAYRERLSDFLEITPAFLNRIVDFALATHLTPVISHSHPGATEARYSAADDFGESRLLPVLQQLLPALSPASLLLTPYDLIGRRFRNGEFVSLDAVEVKGREGVIRRRAKTKLSGYDGHENEFDRQARAIGTAGQELLRDLRVGIVGVGGTGSAVAEQLVRLGVQDVVLVDPDVLELSNVTRVWGARAEDAAQRASKVSVMARHLSGIRHGTVVRTLQESVVRQSVLEQLRERDVVFGCTDNHLSRAVLNRFAHQYLVPVVDMGIRLDARSGSVTAVGGRVTLVGAGLACLRCSNHLDPDRIRAEAMSSEERSALAREGYIQGVEDPQPSVISLNTTVASLAVTAGLGLFVNLVGASPPTDQIYDATHGSIFGVSARHDDTCDVCTVEGGLTGLGDLQIVSAYE
jgi:molybdopterin/thiamine biosynthesis adenylyltransferase